MKCVDVLGTSYLCGIIKGRFVPKTRKINKKALTTDIELTAADVGAADMTAVNKAIKEAITSAIEGEY